MDLVKMIGGLFQVIGMLPAFLFIVQFHRFIDTPSIVGGAILVGAFALALVGVLVCLVGEALRTSTRA